MKRFSGSCEPLCAVDASGVAAWISAIPFEEWPQQHRLPDGKIRPAMVTDLAWHGFGSETDAIVGAILVEHFPGAKTYQRMLSVVMPGHHIDPHVDRQDPAWLVRVHVPLLTNSESRFLIAGEWHNMPHGSAYRFNTEAEHAVVNRGETPRVHLLFDVRN